MMKKSRRSIWWEHEEEGRGSTSNEEEKKNTPKSGMHRGQAPSTSLIGDSGHAEVDVTQQQMDCQH